MRLSAKLFLWVAVFAVLGVIALWLEHERAAAATRAFKARLEAKGERLSYTNHIPPMPPAASNGAPDFVHAASALTSLKADFFPQRMRLVAPGRARVSWREAVLPTDREPDAWPAVAAHVEENRSELAALHAALERPVMVHKLEFEKTYAMLLPHLQRMKGAVNTLSCAVIYDLHEGNRSSAFTNLLAGIRVGGRLQEPLMISQLVRIACGTIMIWTSWEALQEPGWTEPELASLQGAWEEFELLTGFTGSLNMERAMGVTMPAMCRTNFQLYRDLLGATSSSVGSVFDDPSKAGEVASVMWTRLTWPAWTSYADERSMLERHQVRLDGARLFAATNSYALVKSSVTAAIAAQGDPPRGHIMSRMLIPAFEGYFKKVAIHEASRQLVATAIALHRHKLRHGRFPETLSALVPEFMKSEPRDFMDGQPLRYRLLPDGQFLLWSIGDDLVDDGGDGAMPSSIKPNARIWTQGLDLVWPLPASAAGVEADRAMLEARRPSK